MRLRVIHLNVHRFTSVETASASGASNTTSLVAATLSNLAPHIVTLNEVDVRHRPGCLESVASELSLPFVEFFGHVRGTYGNAILSKYPLTRRASVRHAITKRHLRKRMKPCVGCLADLAK